MTHDQMLNSLAACGVIALGFLLLGVVACKISDAMLTRKMKKAGPFLKFDNAE